MIAYGLGIGGLLFVAGLVTFILAPKVGPNPIFGVRVGYSYASREVWDRTNRAGGLLMSLVGLATAVASLMLDAVRVPTSSGIAWLTTGMIAAVLGATGWMFLYARKLARATESARKVVPVKFQWKFVLPVLLSFVVFALVVVYTYPMLPAERLATHFDFSNRPNGWSSRDGFVLGMLGMGGLFVLINIAAVAIATREPLIAFGRWGSQWRMQPERGLMYSAVAFTLINALLIAVYLDITRFNLVGDHLFPLAALLGAIVLMIAILIRVFFLLAERSPAKR